MIPRATYRIQFTREFAFKDAAAIADYLADLGISHMYASPYLQARPDSKHGYDITNHNAFNPELGGQEGFEAMVSAMATHGLEHILDYVPNHMGVGGADNPFWLDVLEWGRRSPYANWFDIDWESHTEYLKEKLLVPFLANQYGLELKSGALELKFNREEGSFGVWLYGTHKLPITPPSYPTIIGMDVSPLKELAEEFAELRESAADPVERGNSLKKNLAQLAVSDTRIDAAITAAVERHRGRVCQLDTWGELDSLIRLQNWRPTYFRVAADDINYRRFFNINELAGIRMERPEVFEHAHRLILHLLNEGKLQGLRIDHIDGLRDPKAYLEKLRANVSSPFYLVVEKILGRHESLREDWPVQGTTGYDFSAQATAVLVQSTAEQRLTSFYKDFTSELEPFADVVRESKITIMENELRSELESLSRDAVRVARLNPYTRDFTRNILRRALKEIIACFPVYRTYVDGSKPQESDQRYIHWAIAQAIKNERELDKSVFEFLEKLLTGELANQSSSDFQKRSALRCAMKAQQLSGPVMAKGLEDTALYRYNRFIALNDVGSAPDQFGLSIAAFHKENLYRAEDWPHTMLATSTHDSKHGEDARARLAALSLYPDDWATKVVAWSRLLRARSGDVEGMAPPSRNDEYLFFQNLIATWPAELTLPRGIEPSALEAYSQRLQAAMIKSIRESRVRSNWISPDAEYEGGVAEFVRNALNADIAQIFFENFLPFQRQIAELGVRNSLVQAVLKMTSPGVPDLYQGSELWDLSLPDPDNRRPIDFALRRQLLSRLKDKGESRCCTVAKLMQEWHDGTIKLFVTHALLNFRREYPELFETGSYEPVHTRENGSMPVIAFKRSYEAQKCLVVACLDVRLRGEDLRSKSLPLDDVERTFRWSDVLSGQVLGVENSGLPLETLFSSLPVAVLTRAT